LNLVLLLEMASSAFGDRVAVTQGGHSLSFSRLFSAAGRAAGRLRATRAERLAFLDVSSPAVPLGLFASAWAGIPFAPLNYRLTGAELSRLIEAVEPCYMVTDDERVRILSERPGTEAVASRDFVGMALRGADAGEASPTDPESIAVLLFTSGTTGPPKAAILRHRHLCSYILSSVEFGSADEGTAALVSVPPYHVAGVAAILSSVYSGRRIVQLPNFSPEAWLTLAREERVTNAFVVPTMLARIVDAIESSGGVELPCLRSLSYGGGKMSGAVIERAMRLLPGTDFTNAYGLTETSSTLSILGPEDHRAALDSDDPKVRRRLTSAGRPIPGIEVEIHDEAGRPVAPGERGEIAVRGEQVSGDYLGRPPTIGADGWFRTRDGGFLDADGYLFVDGRIDDIIVRGGENLSPGEIEDVLARHEGVAECAVVGIPDEEWGEAVAAVVVPRKDAAPSTEELRSWVREHLRSSRTPQRIEFRSALPYNETGKLLRRKVRAELTGEES
jgi:long-chain acyl-CoA synthetase